MLFFNNLIFHISLCVLPIVKKALFLKVEKFNSEYEL
jgi:hypothetical protein